MNYYLSHSLQIINLSTYQKVVPKVNLVKFPVAICSFCQLSYSVLFLCFVQSPIACYHYSVPIILNMPKPVDIHPFCCYYCIATL